MRKSFIIIILLLISACSSKQGVYWCGDHPCINKDEREAYFKKTMIVEIREFNKDKIEDKSEIEALIEKATIDEKERKKQQKILSKKSKREEKLRIKREKLLIKKAKREEKIRVKKEKKLAKKEQKIKIKNEKKLSKDVKVEKKEETESSSLIYDNKNVDLNSNNFELIVEKIVNKNVTKDYPDINEIPD
tara:strand:+ start:2815 stop:3384 length:570 start_codon:yes stop_codon:yes gene_type:complete